MGNGGPDLTFDIVPYNGQAGILKAFAPIRRSCNENGNAVNKSTTGLNRLFHIPFGRHFRADWHEV